MSERPILLTGAAGFIGFHLARRLLRSGRKVIGLDNLNAYYDVSLKRARLGLLQSSPDFEFAGIDLSDRGAVERLFATHRFDIVVNLAAQAGVRYSLTSPHEYVSSNVAGFLNILEGCRYAGVAHLVYASSSSVYGAVTRIPFSEHQEAGHPISVYAATKRANELLAHSYSHAFGLPTTGLRFFTVYGPWGRPDMALFTFTRAILSGVPIDLHNHGAMARDFTYVEDVADAIERLIARPPRPDSGWSGDEPDPASSSAPYRLYNIGSGTAVPLLHLLSVLERCLGRAAIRNPLPMQPGEVEVTWADTHDLARDLDFSPATPVETGVERFVDWYLEHYGVADPQASADEGAMLPRPLASARATGLATPVT